MCGRHWKCRCVLEPRAGKSPAQADLVVYLLQRPLDLLLPELSFDRLSLQDAKETDVAMQSKQRRPAESCARPPGEWHFYAGRTLAAATASASSSSSLPLPSSGPTGPALPPRWAEEGKHSCLTQAGLLCAWPTRCTSGLATAAAGQTAACAAHPPRGALPLQGAPGGGGQQRRLLRIQPRQPVGTRHLALRRSSKSRISEAVVRGLSG